MITIRLKEIAESKGLKMSHLQQRAGLDMGIVRRYWRNETTSVDLRALDKLCSVLGCAPGDLIQQVAVSPSDIATLTVDPADFPPAAKE